jgi:disabled family protein 2
MDDEDDYLSPMPEGFPQLPPPPLQKKDPTKSRMPRKSDTDPRNLDAPTPKSDRSSAPILPDITLSQLLTLGIDDLAHKLNVPAAKLNTMTIVELTTYLNEFIEKSKQTQVIAETPNDSPVFKVSFDDAVFEAKFDDNFGNDISKSREESFVANFDNFNQPPISVIPTADRYAVFREIIDQDIQQQQTHLFEDQHQESIESNNSNSLEEVHEGAADSFDFSKEFGNQFESPLDAQFKQSPLTVNQPSNKIAEALSGVKDRYQALRELRNIVLVEDLFDKTALPPPLASISDSNLSDEIVDDNSSGNQQVN